MELLNTNFYRFLLLRIEGISSPPEIHPAFAGLIFCANYDIIPIIKRTAFAALFYFLFNWAKDMKTSDDYKNFKQAYEQLKEREGGYTTGKNQKKDEPTNMGIKQSTLDRYHAKHPEKDLPCDVKDLNEYQVQEIYKSEYWDNTKIPQIENDRIRNAVFDMNVMGGAGKVVQRALNSFLDANVRVDGIIGKETIKAINTIPNTKIQEFMSIIKFARINYLQNTKNWETAKNGWIKRTNSY